MLKLFKTRALALIALVLGMVAAPAAFAQAALPAGVDAAVTEAGEMLVLGATAVIKMGWW